MTIEHIVARIVPKPWGSTDLRPWNAMPPQREPIGELWFDRAWGASDKSALLLKLLFTTAPLSIQVHPDDAFARSIGLPNGKTEAWYILSADPGAQIAIGLKHPVSPTDLRAAIADGSIADMVQWRTVQLGDIYLVPAGTIHAIGAGIVLAEIQQRNDTTFRLFDYERQRELHIDQAVAATHAEPVANQRAPTTINRSRTAMLTNPYFVVERVDLAAGSCWTIDATRETWMIVIGGDALIGETNVCRGGALFTDAGRTDIHVGQVNLVALLAYVGPDRDLFVLTEQVDKTVGGSIGGDHVSALSSVRL